MDSHEMIDTSCNNEKLISVCVTHKWNIWNTSTNARLISLHLVKKGAKQMIYNSPTHRLTTGYQLVHLPLYNCVDSACSLI